MQCHLVTNSFRVSFQTVRLFEYRVDYVNPDIADERLTKQKGNSIMGALKSQEKLNFYFDGKHTLLSLRDIGEKLEYTVLVEGKDNKKQGIVLSKKKVLLLEPARLDAEALQAFEIVVKCCLGEQEGVSIRGNAIIDTSKSLNQRDDLQIKMGIAYSFGYQNDGSASHLCQNIASN